MQVEPPSTSGEEAAAAAEQSGAGLGASKLGGRVLRAPMGGSTAAGTASGESAAAGGAGAGQAQQPPRSRWREILQRANIFQARASARKAR